MQNRIFGVLFLSLALVGTASPVAAQRGGGPPAGPTRSIEQVRDNVYRVLNNAGFPQVTMIMVTPEGILLADPLNAEFSAWLRGELATRFPGQPVRYVVNTHYHWDHARGGGMFADTATYVAHAEFVNNLNRPIHEARPPGDTDDVNRDGCLTREEAQTGTRGNFDAMNGDGDMCLTQREMALDIRQPDITFAGDRYAVELGGSRVELVHAGNRHTSDNIDLYFPAQRVVFASDYVQLKRTCCGFAFDRKPLAAWIASLRTLESLDFEVIVGNHGDMGTKADLSEARQFLEDLSAAVSSGIAAGRSLEEMQKTIRLEQYRDWMNFEQQLPGVIQSAYLNLTQYSGR
jgi:glyoxylase-like metal-dependent hydrolase (beta-lactamase superfamily II)